MTELRRRTHRLALLCAGACLLAAAPLSASSHREAPLITELPKVDATDFYMFRSYETGREGYVTLIANYLPLQDAYGGPNYFSLDPEAEYVFHVDNTGDGIEDVWFLFDFDAAVQGIALPVGGATVPIPLIQAGVINNRNVVNRTEIYRVYFGRGALGGVDRSLPVQGAESGGPAAESAAAHLSGASLLLNPAIGRPLFGKAIDNIGAKTFPDYESYARNYVMDAEIPGCGTGRVFVGQRKDSFRISLGEVFDLVNLDPVGPRDGEHDDLCDKNVTTLALEVPIACLTGDGGSVIGGWTTARLMRNRTLLNDPSFERPASLSGGWTQVSRLGMPLVNEVVIGLPDKNRFNASRPDGDAALATYVTNPALPELLELLFGVQAPNNFPRTDLVAAFATGVAGLNFLSDGAPHEMLRLNTGIAPTPAGGQNDLGVLGGDNAGFPNGRRPGDDVVDAELRVAMGVLCHAFPGVFCNPADAPSGTLPYTDGVLVNESFFDDGFPYLTTPIPGSPDTAAEAACAD